VFDTEQYFLDPTSYPQGTAQEWLTVYPRVILRNRCRLTRPIPAVPTLKCGSREITFAGTGGGFLCAADHSRLVQKRMNCYETVLPDT